jgi:hypothetical protein
MVVAMAAMFAIALTIPEAPVTLGCGVRPR